MNVENDSIEADGAGAQLSGRLQPREPGRNRDKISARLADGVDEPGWNWVVPQSREKDGVMLRRRVFRADLDPTGNCSGRSSNIVCCIRTYQVQEMAPTSWTRRWSRS